MEEEKAKALRRLRSHTNHLVNHATTHSAFSCIHFQLEPDFQNDAGFIALAAEELGSQVVASITIASDFVVIKNRLGFIDTVNMSNITTGNNYLGINTSWLSKIAACTLAKMELRLQDASKLSPKLQIAYDETLNAQRVEGFAEDNPVFPTLTALGVLKLAAPIVLKWLGFSGSQGFPPPDPVAGSWAANWQAAYADEVSKESLCAFFQDLTWVWL